LFINAASAETKGLEVEVSALLGEGFSLNGSRGLLDAWNTPAARNRSQNVLDAMVICQVGNTEMAAFGSFMATGRGPRRRTPGRWSQQVAKPSCDRKRINDKRFLDCTLCI
jgi:outer membrane receptor protein involved in Fe transport